MDDEIEAARLANEKLASTRLKKPSNCQLRGICIPRIMVPNASARILSLILEMIDGAVYIGGSDGQVVIVCICPLFIA